MVFRSECVQLDGRGRPNGSTTQMYYNADLPSGRIMTNMPGRGGVGTIGRSPSGARQGNCKPSKDSHQETNHPCGIRADTESGPKLHRECNIKFGNG